jgi:hypothetical protein
LLKSPSGQPFQSILSGPETGQKNGAKSGFLDTPGLIPLAAFIVKADKIQVLGSAPGCPKLEPEPESDIFF